MNDDARWMHAALEEAGRNPRAPFGAVIVDVDAGEIVARGVNDASHDPTLHGEIAAIRALASAEVDRAGRTLALFTTAEPCPMCAAACFWAKLDRIVYGVSIPWLVDHGWRQLAPRTTEVLADADPPIAVTGDVLAEECAAFFRAARADA